jgi:hypothetical protein
MRFDPLDDDEKVAKKYEPLPSGDYDFVILDAEETTSKAGNDMLKVKLEVKGEHIYDYLLSKGSTAWKLKAFCRAMNLLDKYETGNLNAGDLIGRKGRVELAIEPATGAYDAKNKVKKYIPYNGGPHVEPAMSDADEAQAVSKVKAAFAEKDEEQPDDLPF